MLDFDQLFKKLLTAFFGDLLNIVRLSLAGHAPLALTTFEDKELFTDLKQGEHRFADLVARLTLDDTGSTLVLAHVEVEGDATAEMGARMYFYNLQLQLRERLPVLPLVIFLNGGPAGLQWKHHDVKVLEDKICEFHYLSLGLSQMQAENLLARDEPLAWALAAFTKPRKGRARLKLECLKRIARAGLDGVRTFLLVDAVETRLQLKDKDEEAYQRLLETEHPQEVIQMELTWSSQIELKAMKKGMQAGRQEVVLRQLSKRFGPLPLTAQRRVEAISSADELDDLAENLLTARSLEELGLG